MEKTNNKVVINVTIYETSNYDMFHHLELNRDIIDCRGLKKSVEKINLIPFKPIIVDSDMNIIDGQHRLKVCKELGISVYYVIIPKGYCETDKAIIALNRYQKQWRMSEFLKYQATVKGGCYKDLLEFEKRHNIGLSNSMVIYPEKSINASVLRNGELEFEKNINAEAIAEFLKSEEVKNLKFCRRREFVLAIRKAFDMYTSRQLKKLKRKIIIVPMSANYEQYLTAFENIIKK